VEASKLLFQLAREAASKDSLLRAKQLYVLGALEVQKNKKNKK
jgi:hypothetical protein